MQSVSLYVHVLLLTVVLAAIVKIFNARRKISKLRELENNIPNNDAPSLNLVEDDVISVRKLLPDDEEENTNNFADNYLDTRLDANIDAHHIDADLIDKKATQVTVDENYVKESVMLFLLAKDNRHFAGYELLQALLAAGFRYGEGQLFHRHQAITGHGPVLFSLAAATNTGTFDLQNIGAFRERGLCLFMETSGSPNIDATRFNLMLSIAKQLSETFDAILLDDKRNVFSNQSLERYQRFLQIEPQKIVDEIME